jgi:hypothetical protein
MLLCLQITIEKRRKIRMIKLMKKRMIKRRRKNRRTFLKKERWEVEK